MSKYTTNTSDKSKRKAITLLFCGGIGLHLFYVGRIKAGIIRLFFGFCFWMAIYAAISTPEIGTEETFCTILLLFLFNLPDFIRLLLGTFRDNVGNALRQ